MAPTTTESARRALGERTVFLLSAGVVSGIVTLVVAAVLGISALQGVRGYVLGEGLWAKAQKRGVIALYQYARTADEMYWTEFEDAVAVTLSDRQARLELLADDPDLDRVREGFEGGDVPAELVPAMTRVMRWGRGLDFVEESLAAWAGGDEAMDELVERAAALREAVLAPTPDAERIGAELDAIAALDDRLTEFEARFSATLNQGALRVERGLQWLVALMAAVAAAVILVSLRRAAARQRAHERAIEASEARYRQFFDHNTLGACLIGADGAVQEVNPAFLSIFGYDHADEVRGRTTAQFYTDPDVRARVREEIRQEGHLTPREMEAARKDGSMIWILVTATQLPDPAGGSNILTMVLDVTEKKLLESEVGRARRLEAMGQIAGGVAHDFNNLLTVIQGNVSLLLSTARKDGAAERRQLLEEVSVGADAAASLTAQLLEFSRGEAPDLDRVDVNRAMERHVGLLGRMLPDSITCRLDQTPDLPPAEISPAHLDQIVLSLALNARDAMPSGGTLTISTATTKAPPADHGSSEAREMVVVTVSDTGVGMDEDTRRRVFEPFFTTKPAHSGTGMGLATVYGIVNRCGGSVDVESTPGNGAVFRVAIPVAPAQAPRPEATPAPMDAVPIGRDRPPRVLLVDDTDAVRTLARRILERSGYEVVEAEDAHAALEALDGGEDAPDLILSDILMAGIDGPEMVRLIRERWGDTPVVYMSGYTDQALATEEMRRSDTSFLPKPFRAGELRNAVDGALGRTPPRPEA
ncbi:MAG: response regulator [Longimicrobiales bacterium]